MIAMSNIFNIPLTLDPACPKDTIWMMPPDVAAELALLHLAAVMTAHGIINRQAFNDLAERITEHAVQAAREGRVGVITNLGDVK